MLFELIQVAMGLRDRLSRTPSEEEWWRLYQMAEEQAVTSFVFPALEILNRNGQKPPTELLFEWIGLSEQVRAQNELVNKEAARLTALFENEGHRTAILKGQANARLYKCHTDSTDNTENFKCHTGSTERVATTLLRQPGDIDIWVSGGKERVVQTLRKLHLIDGDMSIYRSAEKAEDSYHHIHLLRNEQGVDVEVHFRPSSGNQDPFSNRRLQKYLSQEIERENEMVGEGFRVPSLRFALVMQLAHIQRHALGLGVGLRQVIDYYFLLRKWRMDNGEFLRPDGNKRPEVERIILAVASAPSGRADNGKLKYLGLDHIAGALMWVMKEVLLMDEDWMIARPDEKRGRMLLDIIMAGGNFGHFSPVIQQGFSFSTSLKYHINQFKLLRFDARETIWGELNYYGRFLSSIPERIRRRSWTLRALVIGSIPFTQG